MKPAVAAELAPFSADLPEIPRAKVRRARNDTSCPASGFADKVFVPASQRSYLPPPPHPLDACWGTSQMCSDDMSEFVFSCPLVLPFRSLRLFRHPLLTHRGCNAYENRSRVTLC